MGKQHTSVKVITAGMIGAAGFMLAGPVQSASAKTVTVKSGDTVWQLATKYGVSMSQLEKSNHLKNGVIYAGQKLVLSSSKATTTNTTTTTTKTTTKKANAAAASVSSLSSTSTATASTYTVKSGDTLWKVSKKYGVTIAQLKQWNGLKSDMIAVGQKLAVKKAAATSTASSSATATTTPKATKSATTTKKTTTKAATASTTTKATTTKADAAATTSVASYAVSLVSKNIPYVWGGASLKGMDCSGLTQYVYAHTTGVSLPHNTVAQEKMVSKHSVSSAVPGDLLFWGASGATYHVGIYIGNNEYVNAPVPGENVQIATISKYFAPSFAGTVNG
ncbi:C40 family peptidase [Secundilactobacillus muriivasis]